MLVSVLHRKSTLTAVSTGRGRHHFDIVLSYFEEPPEEVRKGLHIIKNVRIIAALHSRVIIYTKGAADDIKTRHDKIKQLEEL